MTTPTPPRPAPAQEPGGIKDTIESILIAFILAFVFRAFVVEAFVIPTGSMAPTLMGAHMRYTCNDCGYSFTTNYSARGEGDDLVIPRTAPPTPYMNERGQVAYRPFVQNVTCPNCGYQLPAKDTTSPSIHYGDRILVLKYLYLLQPPTRWDVVVFKSPDPPNGVSPKRYDYSTNYIKRLIGRPGESVMVLDGDVYVAPANATGPADFHVQAKPRYAQEALWRVVYDNDYYPRKLDRSGRPFSEPWTPVPNGSGWDLASDAPAARSFHFDNPAGAGGLFFNPKANPGNHALTDWLGYDQNDSYPRADAETWANNVSDLKLAFSYTRTDGDGPLRLTLTKHDTTFVAELTPTSVRLIKKDSLGPETELANVPTPLPAGKPVHVEFTNVDYRVAVRIDDRDVIVTTPAQYAPNVQQLLNDYNTNKVYPKPAVQIDAANQKSTLAHVGLWRDVHYINSRTESRLHWAMPFDFPNNVVRLSDVPGKEEYFVMGDNSLISGDARYWTYGVDFPAEDLHVDGGRVPARFMLGKAFFVYWPAGFRPTDAMPGIVPNFGQMRFIH